MTRRNRREALLDAFALICLRLHTNYTSTTNEKLPKKGTQSANFGILYVTYFKRLLKAIDFCTTRFAFIFSDPIGSTI